jgi:hypothetical protein
MTCRLGLFVTALSLSVACGGTSVTEITGPSTVRCATEFPSSAPTVAAGGGQVNISVAAARECTWTATSEATWINISPSSGQGEGTLTLSVHPNQAAASRSGAIVINEARLVVAQEPAPCQFDIDRELVRVSHEGGSVSIALRTLEGCSWTSASDVNWAKPLTSTGSGSATVRFDAEPNRGGERSANLVLAGRAVRLVQDSVPPPTPTPTPAPPAPTPPPPSPPPPEPPPTPAPPTPPSPPAPPPTTPPAPLPTPPAPPPVPPPPSPPPVPTPVSDIKVEGDVSELIGTCPGVSFRLNGQTVYAHGGTKFKGGNCRSLGNGRGVHVDGILMSDGTISANEIDLR